MIIRLIVGAVVILVGVVAALVYAAALVDPIGAQSADDAGAFRKPPTWRAAAIGLVASIAVACGGWWLVLLRRIRHPRGPGGGSL